jgi:mono/diheme cytochrome c family protein
LFDRGLGGARQLIKPWVCSIALAALPLSAHAGDGAGQFLQNCALCHQSGATGLPGQFPRLAGRVRSISSAEKGRGYLIDVLTYGLAGTIRVDDQPIIGVMPPFASLPNAVIADILNYLQTLGDKTKAAPKSFSEKEVAAGRAKDAKALEDVQAERQALQADKIIE